MMPDSQPQRRINRRTVLRSLAAAGAVTAVNSPLTIQPATAQDEEKVELTTDANVPADTSISTTVTAYTSEGDTVEKQSVTVDDGVNTYDLDQHGAHSDDLWELDVELSTNDDTVTPKLLTATIEFVPVETSDSDGDGDSDDTESWFEGWDPRDWAALRQWAQGLRNRLPLLEREVDDSTNETDDSDGGFIFDFSLDWLFGN